MVALFPYKLDVFCLRKTAKHHINEEIPKICCIGKFYCCCFAIQFETIKTRLYYHTMILLFTSCLVKIYNKKITDKCYRHLSILNIFDTRVMILISFPDSF